MIIKTKMLLMIFIAATLVCSDFSHCAETGTAVPSRTIQGTQLPQGVSRQMIQNYQQGGGQAISPSSVQNLPPGTLQNLPPGVIQQLPSAVQNLPPATSQNLPPGVIQQLPSAVQKQISDGQASSGAVDSNIGNGNLNDFSDINSLESIADMKESVTGEKGDGVDETFSETDSAGDNEEKNENTSVARAGNLDSSISIIEKQYRSAYSSPLASGLRQFGYDIFSSARVQPSSLAVPDKNYLLGTGDNLLIRVWGGTVDAVYPAVVDREGIVNIPKIGPISVVGVKYGALESVIRNEAEKYVQGINISITLTKLRSLEIYVVGEVSNPGLHMLPSFSTIFDGLIYGGGVKKSGTLRNIKLYRDGDEKHPFDLYDLILKGDRKSDHMLKNKDVIFVEKIGKTAAVAGAVNHQGIFEIIGRKSIKELAALAGGILPQAFGDRIYLKRFDQNREFIFQDIDIAKNPQAWNKIMVSNGDLLELDFMGSTLPYVVRLEGHVWKPDLFHYKSGMALSDILTSTDLLMPDTLMEFALIYRYNSETTRTSPMRFPLSRVFAGNYNAQLEPYDKIVILSRESFGIKEKITLNGAVWKPGDYSFQPGLKLKDALALAGGVNDEARIDKIEVQRQVKTNEKFETRYIKLNLEQHGAFELKANDTISIPRFRDYVVRLEGHVWNEKNLKYHIGITLSDVLISKDLPKPEDILKPDAVMDFGLIYRYDSTTTATRPIRFPLFKVFEGTYDVELKPFDKVFVLSKEKVGIKESFNLKGAVWNPGQFSFKPGILLNDALALAGGLKNEARTDKIELNRQIKNEEKIETEYMELDLATHKNFKLQANDIIYIPILRDYVVKLEGHIWNPRDFKYNSTMTLSDILISKDLPRPEDLLKPDVMTEFGLIYRYDPHTTRTTAMRFPLLQVFAGSYDIPLQPFDRVVVLSRETLGIKEKFTIRGALWNEGEFKFEPGLKLADAVALAGGIKFGARSDKVEVARQVITGNKVETNYITLHLAKDGDFMLHRYDAILIPRIKGASDMKEVTLSGEVNYPATYAIRPNERISDLIQRAGGFTENAYLYGAKYTSEEARKIQQQSIDKMLEKLKLGSLVASSEMAQVEDTKAAENSLQEMINTLQGIRAEGRIAIKLSDIDVLRGTSNDFVLQDGATLNIPSRPSFVSVMGSVYSPGSFLYEPDQKLDFYLDKSGGSSLSADEKHMYILKANGEIISMGQTQGIFSKIYNTVLVPGDTIVVPEDMERVPYIKKIGNISDIVFKIATTAGVALAL